MFLSEKPGTFLRINVTVSSITVSVFNPRKSILSSPRSFNGFIEYWLTMSLPLTSRQSGTYSERSRSLITTPAACTPALRESPSRAVAYSINCFVGGSVATALFNSGFLSTAEFRVMFSSFGIIFAIRSPSRTLSPITRATSRTTLRAFSRPKVMICATRRSPYFCRTYSRTSPRRASQKSTSISGGEIRSGLRKRSKISPYCNGSISVIPRT